MIDLHFHSTFSDGSESPESLAEMGFRAGIYAMALTDHDSSRGTARFIEAASKLGIRSVSGIEISVAQSAEYGNELHILCYGSDPNNAALSKALCLMREGRDARNHEILDKLAALNRPLHYADVAKLAGDNEVIGRPHIAAAMVTAGYADSKKDAFARFLAYGAPAYVERRKLFDKDAIPLIRAAGGVAVLAHPHLIGMAPRNMKILFARLMDFGLSGVEAYHSEQPQDITEIILRDAKDLGLLVTGGSDFHGAFSPNIKLGSGSGSLVVPDYCFDTLVDAIANAGH